MKHIILKLSGKVIDSVLSDSAWIDFFKKAKNEHIKIAVVHGAGEQVTDWSNRLGLKTEFYHGQRVSDTDTMDVVLALQSGVVNSKLTAKLNAEGTCAAGFSGISFGCFIVDQLEPNLGFVGYPTETEHIQYVKNLFDDGVIPIFSTVCMNMSGQPINVNADIFTINLAESLGIDDIIMVSDIPAIRIDESHESFLSKTELEHYLHIGEFTDGMIPKVESMLLGFEKGVQAIWVGDSDPEKILSALLNNSSYGTKITKEEVYA